MGHNHFSILFLLFLMYGSIVSKVDDSTLMESDNFEYVCWFQKLYRNHRITWTIEHYDILSRTVLSLKSPEFPFEGIDSRNWYVEFAPWKLEKNDRNALVLNIRNNSNLRQIRDLRTLINVGTVNPLVKLSEFTYGVSIKEIHEELDWGKNTNKSLIINCTLEYVHTMTEVCHQFLKNPSKSNKMIKDILQVFSINTALKDLIISDKREEFGVQVMIRDEGKKGFADMSSFERSEIIINSPIRIDNFEPEAFVNMLSIIFSDEDNDLVLRNFARKLLIVAERYDLKTLRKLCVAKINNYLTVDNVLETLEFADVHSISYLKKVALEFAVLHLQTIQKTYEFGTLMRTQPELIIEIFSFSSSRSCELSDDLEQKLGNSTID